MFIVNGAGVFQNLIGDGWMELCHCHQFVLLDAHTYTPFKFYCLFLLISHNMILLFKHCIIHNFIPHKIAIKL